MSVLAMKILLAPTLVVGASLAGRRFGGQVSGVLVALPIVAGPILAIIAWQQGPTFGARAASSALLGLLALALFAVTVALVARRRGWAGSLAAGWAACLALDLAQSRWSPAPFTGLVLAIAAAVVTDRVLAGLTRRCPPSVSPKGGLRPPWWDLPARAVATVALVATVTGAAAAVGPGWSGMLAPFPIASSVVAGFTLAQAGPAAAVTVLRGLAQGLVGFAVFCYLVAVLLPGQGVVASFAAATATTVTVQAALQGLLRAVNSSRSSPLPGAP